MNPTGQITSTPRSLHSPAPWFVSSSVIVVGGEDFGKLICSTMAIDAVSPMPLKEAMANANLIAAAPELLEALRELADCSPCKNGCAFDDMTCASNKARAALAKAEGAPSDPSGNENQPAHQVSKNP